jgi:hypothetical protein
MIEILKVLTAVLVVVGLVLGLAERLYKPHAILLESSPKQPTWLPWLSWGISAASAIGYIVLDQLT